MSSEQDKDLVAKQMHVACRAHSGERSDQRERLSEDPAPLTHTLSATR